MLVVQSTPRFSVLSVGDDDTLYRKLIEWFETAKVEYAQLRHEPTLTSEASAAVRVRLGWTETTLKCGAKAMLFRRSKNAQFVLCVLAADRKVDYKKLKKAVAKDLRMATEEEVMDVARCLPGAVPPFGSQFAVPAATFVDTSLSLVDVINFNCGLRTRSVKMTWSTYLALEQPHIADFS